MPTNIDETAVTIISNYSNYLPCWVPPDEPTELPPGLCPPDVPADWVSIIVWVRIPPPEEWPDPWLPPDGADVVLEVTTGLTVVVVVVVVGFGVVVRSVGEEYQNLKKFTLQLSNFEKKSLSSVWKTNFNHNIAKFEMLHSVKVNAMIHVYCYIKRSITLSYFLRLFYVWNPINAHKELNLPVKQCVSYSKIPLHRIYTVYLQ